MEGKLGELHFDVEALTDPFNTHGTEIAPRSYVVGEDLEHLCRHGGKLSPAHLIFRGGQGGPGGPADRARPLHPED